MGKRKGTHKNPERDLKRQKITTKGPDNGNDTTIGDSGSSGRLLPPVVGSNSFGNNINDNAKKKKEYLSYDDVVKKYNLKNISTVDDIMGLVDLYYNKKIKGDVYLLFKKYIDFKKVLKLVDPLIKLKNMVGLKKIKEEIVSLIRCYLCNMPIDSDMKHMIFYGPPGSGKTTIISIIAEILSVLDVFDNGGKKIPVKYRKGTDFTGEFVGQSSQKTLELLDESKYSILIIDEAYSLGYDKTRSNSNGFSKDVSDVLNQYLSEHSDKIIVILAGYKDDIENCVLSYNKGLDRRFSLRFTMGDYTDEEMVKIFHRIVIKCKWKVGKKAISSDFIKKNRKYLKHQGGDLSVLFQQAKIMYSKREFYTHKTYTLMNDDIKKGMDIIINMRKNKSDNNDNKHLSFYT